jgi:hypothetical protein
MTTVATTDTIIECWNVSSKVHMRNAVPVSSSRHSTFTPIWMTSLPQAFSGWLPFRFSSPRSSWKEVGFL